MPRSCRADATLAAKAVRLQQLLLKLSRARQKQLEKQLATLDAAIAAQLRADATLAAKAVRLQQVQGVGRFSAFTLLALLPELGTLRDSEAAALTAVAPLNRDSGQFRGQRHIHGGRRSDIVPHVERGLGERRSVRR